MWYRKLFRSFAVVAGVCVLSVGLAAAPARADTDPAIPTVEAFDKALLDTMKGAKDLGVSGRYRKLEPAIDKAFNLPVMTRYAVGDKWSTFSDDEHQGLIDAFKRLTVASYAHNFNGYGGEHFEINPVVQTRNLDKVVLTKLVRVNDKPVVLNYRLRLADGTWKIIDVYYNGNISQLTIRRNDLAATGMVGGAKGLTKSMNAQADKLLK